MSNIKHEDLKELDDLIGYIENELLPGNCNKKLIHEAICTYAELWHSKQANDISQQRELLMEFTKFAQEDEAYKRYSLADLVSYFLKAQLIKLQ